jgi:hypothetical protein
MNPIEGNPYFSLTTFQEEVHICEFNKEGFCTALGCYDNCNCGAKDENGYPKYL